MNSAFVEFVKESTFFSDWQEFQAKANKEGTETEAEAGKVLVPGKWRSSEDGTTVKYNEVLEGEFSGNNQQEL